MKILPEEYRKLIRSDGLHLYKHIVHPDIPDLAFAGYNHGFLHIPTVEIGMMWVLAVLRGDLKLPSREKQLQAIEKEAKWKELNLLYEPTRCAQVGPRFFSYMDDILGEIGVSGNRKNNFISEILVPYRSSDYKNCQQESLQYFSKGKKKQ